MLERNKMHQSVQYFLPSCSICPISLKTIFRNRTVFISLKIAFPQKVKLKCVENGKRKRLRVKTLNRIRKLDRKWKGKKPRKYTNGAVGVRICSLTSSKLWLNVMWQEPTQAFRSVSFRPLAILETSHYECDKERNSENESKIHKNECNKNNIKTHPHTHAHAHEAKSNSLTVQQL